MIKPSKTIDMLNALLRGEISAVESHKMAIDTLSKAPYVAVLRDNLASHEDRARRLSAEIVKQGGQPVQTSGAWGTFTKLVEGGASAFGEKAAIAALEEGENRGHDSYKREIANVEAPDQTFVEGLLKEQHRSRETLSKLRRTMGDETTPARL